MGVRLKTMPYSQILRVASAPPPTSPKSIKEEENGSFRSSPYEVDCGKEESQALLEGSKEVLLIHHSGERERER